MFLSSYTYEKCKADPVSFVIETENETHRCEMKCILRDLMNRNAQLDDLGELLSEPRGSTATSFEQKSRIWPGKIRNYYN